MIILKSTHRIFGFQVVNEGLQGLEVVMLHKLRILTPKLLGVQDAPSERIKRHKKV